MTRKAYEIGLPVVSEKFLFDCIQNGRMVDLMPYLIKQNIQGQSSENSSSEEEDEVDHTSDDDEQERKKDGRYAKKKEEYVKETKKKESIKSVFSHFQDETTEMDLKITKKEAQIQQNLLFHLAKLVGKEKFQYSDVCFVVQNEKFYTCKAILASRSRYFKELFEKMKHEQCVIQYQVEPSIFFATLVWITTGVLDVENAYAYLSVASHADKLGLLDLKEYSLLALERKVKEITSQNVLQESLYLWDQLLNSVLNVDQNILYQLTDYIGSKISLLVSDADFYRLSPKGMIEILKNTNMNIEEALLFEKLIQWAGCQINNKFPQRPQFISITEQLAPTVDMKEIVVMDPKALRNYLAEYLPHVLFEHMSQETILTRVEPTNMFNEKEILEMTKASLSPNTTNYMILGKSYNTRRKKRNFTSKPLKGPVIFHYTLNKKDIFNRIDFPTFDLYGMEWFCSSQGEYGNYLGLFLYNKLISNGTLLNDNPIITQVSMRIKNRIKDRSKTGTFTTEWKDRKAWGFSNFLEKKMLLDPDNGWMDHKGNITIEIAVERK